MLAHAALLLLAMSQSSIDLPTVRRQITSSPAEAAQTIRQRFSADDLKKGINPFDQGTMALFAIETGSTTSQVDVAVANTLASLTHLGGGLYAAVKSFEDGDGFLVSYIVDGTVVRSSLPLEVYEPNKFTLPPADELKGELRAMGELKSDVFPGTTRQWYVYMPPNLDPNRSYPVLIGCDAQWDREWMTNALENCAREGLIAPTVGVFIEPGQANSGTYSNRSKEYDSLNSNYSKFLLDEILPQVEKLVKISTNPAERAITGMSSGGICSFTACWERPDQFGVAISFIGSFANIASGESKREGGHNYPFLIRKTEKKPIRVFLQDGENDLNNDHGSWWICNLQMQSALQYKGYDVVWVPGKGFHSTKHARRVFDQALTWWQKPAK